MEIKTEIDLKKYKLYDEYPQNRFQFIQRELPDKYSRNDKTRFVYKRCIFDDYIHFGEYIAYRCGQKLGIPVCEIELLIQNEKSPKEEGSISYYDLNQDEELISAHYILYDYTKKNNIDNMHLADITMILDAVEDYFKQNNRPEGEFIKFKQDFIDMCVFDLYLGNFDRSLQNWDLRRNKKTGEMGLYSLYDNEAILGFAVDDLSDYKSFDDILRYNQAVTSKIITPEDRNKGKRSDFIDLYCYILKTYPQETENSTKKMQLLSLDDLSGFLDEIPYINGERKQFALKNYMYRKHILDRIFESKNQELTKTKNKRPDNSEFDR